MTALRRVVVGCLATALFPAMSWADGGAVVFSKLCGGYRITLFAAPPSPRAGPVDFSVLIQAVDSGAPVLDIPVSIHVCPEDAPQRSSGGPATTAAATNKLFRAIQLDLSEPGRWHVEVVVHSSDQPAHVDALLDVAPPLPSWLDLGLWIGWPAAAILLFAMHQCLVTRRAQQPGSK